MSMIKCLAYSIPISFALISSMIPTEKSVQKEIQIIKSYSDSCYIYVIKYYILILITGIESWHHGCLCTFFFLVI